MTTSVSQGVSGLVSALRLDGERNRIVISEYEFPTVGQIAHAQELRGAEVVHVRPASDGSIAAERFVDAIDDRTALVCCTALSFRTGHRHDVTAIAEAAHAHGAIVLADSYRQSGQSRSTFETLGADVVTGGDVKDCWAPRVSASCGSVALLESLLPTQTGWFADEDIFAMSIADYSPHASARRFDSGTPPVPNLYAVSRGCPSWPRPACLRSRLTCATSMTVLIGRLEEIGATVVTPADPALRGPLVCVRSADVVRLCDELLAERIVSSHRDDNLRISAHLYNTIERRRPRRRRSGCPASPARIDTRCRRRARFLLLPVRSVRRPPQTRSRTFTSPSSDGGTWPCVVLVHGGFWRERWDRTMMTPLARDVAEHGLAAWNLEYRRVGQEGGGWPGNPARRRCGCRCGSPRLPEVDTSRVVVIGHSAGGHLALWLAGRRTVAGRGAWRHNRAFCHARPSHGRVSAIWRAGARDGLGGGAVEALVGGSPSDEPDRYAVASPTALLPLGVPQLLVHGLQDVIVPPSQSRAHAAAAMEAGDAGRADRACR